MSRFNTLFDSPRAHRVSAVVLLILATVLVISAVAIPSWFLYHRYAEKEAMMTRQLSSYTALNQLRPRMMQAVEILKAKETKKYFLKGATPGLAGADLQDVTKALIESNNARMFSATLLPHKDENGYRLVAATLSMSSTIQNLRQVLYAIESREPYLTIDNISIRSQVPSGFKPAPGGEPDMFIQFDVSGLAPIAAAESAPAGGKANTSMKAKAAS